MNRSAVLVLAWCAVVVALAGCGGISRNVIERPGATTTTTTATTTAPTTPTANRPPCVDETVPPADSVPATASYRPLGPNPAPGAMPEGTTMSEIQDRPEPRLRVGVDETTQGLAYRDPADGLIKGMEVDLAHKIARRIIPDSGHILELVTVRTDDKLAAVQDGRVDLAIDAISMNCKRWAAVDFSTEYLTTDQQLLVPKDSTIHTTADLDGRTVCVTSGSSSVGILEKYAPGARLREVDARTDCLVALQEGSVDAYFGHDTFLHGMVLQDPTLMIRPLDDLASDVTASHYGIAVAHGNEDLVRFVNQALDEMRVDGTWDTLHDGLEQGLGLPDADPPVAVYLPEGS